MIDLNRPQGEKIDSTNPNSYDLSLNKEKSYLDSYKIIKSQGLYILGDVNLEEDWDLGEGEFRWKGRSSRTGLPNRVTIDWTKYELNWFLAEFTNLDNSYAALPRYVVDLFRNGNLLSTIYLDTQYVADEDLGNEPTINDKYYSSRKITDDIDQISVRRQVAWS